MMKLKTGTCNVITTDRRGMTAEEHAVEAVKKIISIGPNAHPAIRQQAEAYRAQLEKVIEHRIKLAIRSDRTTVYNLLMDAGHPELAKAILEK